MSGAQRSSVSWTQASSAAGYTLRYLEPVRAQLTDALGSEEEADEGLRLMIAHFVTAGFGKHNRGRLRDFFMKAVRSTVKTREEQNGGAASTETLAGLQPDDPVWLRRWRDVLLQRVWRKLERQEHLDPTLPLYTLLSAASTAPADTAGMLSVRIASESGMTIDEKRIGQLLPEARRAFAQLLADEISSTLEAPDKKAVRNEIKTLELTAAFRNLKG